MLNLVEKYSAEPTTDTDEGVVAIEYVLIAGLVAIGVGITFATDLWDSMFTALNSLF